MLTQKEIDSAKPQAKEYTLTDMKRLALRIRTTGSKVWIYKYMWGGKVIPMTIQGGSLKEIRAQANMFNDWLDIGIRQPDGTYTKTSPKHKLEADEQRAKAEQEAERIRLERERKEAESRKTVSQLFELWERLGLSDRKAEGVAEIRRMFNKDVLPAIGHLYVEDIRKGHIVQILNDIKSRDNERMPEQSLSLIRQMFNFAVEQDIIENEPTATLDKSKWGGNKEPRTRVLSDTEIRKLTELMPESGLSHQAQKAVWIMLSTGCRVGELMAAQWSHIDLEAGTWTIPAENSKNGKKHTIYLSSFAASQFRSTETINPSRWVFPNRSNKNHVDKKTLAKQIGDRQQSLKKRAPMKGRSKQTDTLVLGDEKWTPHDLRRTAATIMGELNVRPDVIEKCLNHIEQNKIVKTYQRQTLIPEQQEAWRVLGERLEILTSGQSNVIPLPKREQRT